MLTDAILYFLGVHFLTIMNTLAALVALVFVAFIVVELRENIRLHRRDVAHDRRNQLVRLRSIERLRAR